LKEPSSVRTSSVERSQYLPSHPKGTEANKLRGEILSYEKRLSELEVSVTQHKEIAEIATQQAQTMSDFRDNYEVMPLFFARD
jgi:hypothetical protein